jgi:RNA polymerase sigma factor (sigma-70 family)
MAGKGGRPLDEFNRPEIVRKLSDAAEFERFCHIAFPVLHRIVNDRYRGQGLNYHDVEDIVIDTLFAASTAVLRFELKEAKLTTWLIRILINKTNNHLKARSRKKRTPPRETDSVADASAGPERAKATATKKGKKKGVGEEILLQIRGLFGHLSEEEREKMCWQAFESLNEGSRDILWVWSEERSDEAKADSLNISVNNYRVKRLRALQQLLAAAKKITAL